MNIEPLEDFMISRELVPYFATVCFALAILHTFLVHYFQQMAHKYPNGSVGENLFHLLGEVEVVFGIWAGIFIGFFILVASPAEAVQYLETRNYTEPAFVFVIMVLCASRPILNTGEWIIQFASKLLPFEKSVNFYISCLVVGPLLGSFITEPAAMTITALILLKTYYKKGISEGLKYATLGLLFVNISIGGTLTPYAAPPVLMVAPVWGWDLQFMLEHFGWKAALAVVISTAIVVLRYRPELAKVSLSEESSPKDNPNELPVPYWVIGIHLVLLVGVVLAAHHMVVFTGIFLFFLAVATVTQEYQSPLKLRESLLVGAFLGGLVILGGQQRWWLEPVLTQLTALPLYLGAITLTAFTDNAAITYLGSQVPNLSEFSKYALVSGAVVGGGLTVIANAPNPAGFSTLNSSFGNDGISPLLLLKAALIPTLVAGLCFWFL